ncbi:MAG TPA: hypothetical protein V6D19_12980 [Stenomitos sp.]
MARYDFKVVYPDTPSISQKWNVPSGGVTTIKAGEPTKTVDAAAASPYLGTTAIMVDGDGTTAQRFTGIAKSDSTDTASAAGIVYLWLPLPGLMYSGKAKTASTADTQAEVDALRGKRVVFDLTSTTWSIDAAAADAVANTVVIVDGDYQTQTLYFAVSSSFLNFRISA